MHASFIITLDVEDTSVDELRLDAMNIQEVLEEQGVAVISVTPWARPSQSDVGMAPLSPKQILPAQFVG